MLTTLFPVWTIVATLVAFLDPSLFSKLPASTFPLALSFLMLFMGLTLSFSDLRRAFRKPLLILFAFGCCYIAMPLLAVGLASVFRLPASLAAGLILVGIVSGGQASNLCTYIARGDVALSVAMTTVTTLSAVFMLPILSAVFLRTVLELDAIAMAVSTAQIVVLPVVTGVLLNGVFPRLVTAMRPLLPLLGMGMLMVLIAGPVAQTAPLLVGGGEFGRLVLPVVLLHLGGGVFGYVVPRMRGVGEETAITTGFETGFKSPVLAFVLACRHFEGSGVRVAAAVSIIVLAPLAALLAVVVRGRTVRAGVVEVGPVVERVRLAGRERKFKVVGMGGVAEVVGYERLGVVLARFRRRGRKVARVVEID